MKKTGTRQANSRDLNWIAGIALFVITMALYWPATTFPFVNYDDQLYVYQNPVVLKGLTWDGLKWALTANVAANWHPLTVLSHMADCSAYHLFAGGHHLTNILLHSVDVVLLFVLIRRMTGGFLPGVVSAALFAWHPLNVESVAWIAERKNVLSTLFFILTLLAYLRYGKNPKPSTYALTLILFALGLAAKPMLVTLPFLLFLLDYWPLQRAFPEQKPSTQPRTSSIPFLLLEKVPFLALSAADCIITYVSQIREGTIQSLASVSLAWRLMNIPVAYVTYLEKTFWPIKLGLLYSFPEKLPVISGAISLVLLLIGTVAAWHWREKFRWLMVGWFWFLGTLIPVIGVVQSGVQSWADRHAYVPLMGIFLIIGCGVNELWISRPTFRPCIALGVAAFLCFCVVLTRQQIGYWRDSVTLFSRAVAINPGNPYAQYLLGAALNGQGRFAEAVEHFAMAARITPQNGDYQYNLGLDLINIGKPAEAEEPLSLALKENPNDPALHNTLGVALMQSGKPHEAEQEFSQAIALRPDYSKPYINLGKVQLETGQASSAITNFAVALRLEPNVPETLENLASAYAAAGDSSNAISTANLALKLAQSQHENGLAEKISKEIGTFQAASLRK